MPVIIKKILLDYFSEAVKSINGDSYGFIILPVVIFITLGYVLNWVITRFLSNKKVSSEIFKLSVDSKKGVIENIEKLHEYEKAVNESIKELNCKINEIAMTLGDSKKLNFKKLNQNLDMVVTFFFTDVMDRYSKYFDIFEVLYHNNHKKNKFFISDSIFKLYQTICKFLEVINCDALIELSQRERVKISKESINYTIRFVENHRRWFDFKIRKEFSGYLNSMNIHL